MGYRHFHPVSHHGDLKEFLAPMGYLAYPVPMFGPDVPLIEKRCRIYHYDELTSFLPDVKSPLG